MAIFAKSWRTRRLIVAALACGAMAIGGSAGAASIALAAGPGGGPTDPGGGGPGDCGTTCPTTETTTITATFTPPPTTAPGAGGLPERLGGPPGGAVSGVATQSPGAVAGTRPGQDVKAATPGSGKGAKP
jgi:hypothetical protein